MLWHHFRSKYPIPQYWTITLQYSTMALKYSTAYYGKVWTRKVNSPEDEAAIDQFSEHLIAEWVTDLCYSHLTPDKDGLEEVVFIINGVLGEISGHAREVNIIHLLTTDTTNLFFTHLEVFHTSQAKI